jgi:hypothetical protein
MSACHRHAGPAAPVRAPALQSFPTQRLPLGTGESMNLAGASRRSAAPGSQSVGVAEYGDVPCSPLRSLKFGPLATPPSAPTRSRKFGESSPIGENGARGKTSAVRRNIRGSSCHRHSASPPQHELCFAHRTAPFWQWFFALSPPSAEFSLPKMRANPSFNLTFSGWLRQPPNAS